MVNIYDCYEMVKFITNTNPNGYITVPEFNLGIAKAQNLLFNKKMAERQGGNELALVALKPFYKTTNVTTDSSGYVAYPTRWAETQGMYKEIAGATLSVRQMLHNEIQDALGSAIYPIASNPRWLEQQTGVTIYPKEIQTLDWHYISSPITPVLSVTYGTNNVTYDPLTSVQLEFDTQFYMEIIYLTLDIIGVNLADAQVQNLIGTYSISDSNGTAN